MLKTLVTSVPVAIMGWGLWQNWPLASPLRRLIQPGGATSCDSEAPVEYIEVDADVSDIPSAEEGVWHDGVGDWARRRRETAGIARLSPLSEWRNRRLAQRLSWDMSLLLALWRKTDLSLFLPPPPSLSKTTSDANSRDARLRDLLNAVLGSESAIAASDECSEFERVAALRVLPSADWLCPDESAFCVSHDDPLPSPRRRRRLPSPLAERRCLQAMLAAPEIAPAQWPRLMSVLASSVQQFGDDPQLCGLVAQLLGRLGGDRSRVAASALHQGGWLGLLAAWSREEDVRVALPAWRTLRNLALRIPQLLGLHEEPALGPLSPDLYILHPMSLPEERSAQVDVVFVHGLLGGVERTWRQRDSARGGLAPVAATSRWRQVLRRSPHPVEDAGDVEARYTQCWARDWLAGDLCPLRARVLAVDYDSAWSEWSGRRCSRRSRLSLADRAESLRTALLAAGVGRRPLVWVTHSMGGLVVKQLLVSSPDSCRLGGTTRGVVFLACPHAGSTAAATLHTPALRHLLLPSSEMAQLRPDSRQLQQLQHDFGQLCARCGDSLACLSVAETQETRWPLGVRMLMVDPRSADPGVGQMVLADVNHLDVCKPASRHCHIYRRIVQFISTCATSHS